MFRTLLVLLFLAACGVYFHQNNAHTTPQAQTQAPTGAGTALDDSSLQALKKVLPAQLFEKEVQPAIEQNKRGGLNSEQLSQLLERLKDMSRELGGKASQAAGDAVKQLEQALPQIRRHSIIALCYDGAVRCGINQNLPVMQKTLVRFLG